VNLIKQPTEPRPFYVIKHNPNTIDLVEEALDGGANGIEPDVNVYLDRPDELCISHLEGDSDAPPLEIYLTKLREIVLRDQRLCLIVFDCKPGIDASLRASFVRLFIVF
jgi:hypothetical protein